MTPSLRRARKCEQLTGLKIPGSTLVITKAEAIPDAPPNTVQVRPPLPDTVAVAVPSYCRAQGVIDQRVGVDNKTLCDRLCDRARPIAGTGAFCFRVEAA